jgi:hypothetical protein
MSLATKPQNRISISQELQLFETLYYDTPFSIWVAVRYDFELLMNLLARGRAAACQPCHPF